MRKVIVVMALVVLSALTLVGCKKDNEEDVKSDTMTEVSASMEKLDETVENSTEISDETTAPEGEGGGNEFLNDGETVKVSYNGKEYIYKMVNSYEIEKNGYAHILRNAEKTTLTLITCKHNTNKQLIVICELVEIK